MWHLTPGLGIKSGLGKGYACTDRFAAAAVASRSGKGLQLPADERSLQAERHPKDAALSCRLVKEDSQELCRHVHIDTFQLSCLPLRRRFCMIRQAGETLSKRHTEYGKSVLELGALVAVQGQIPQALELHSLDSASGLTTGTINLAVMCHKTKDTCLASTAAGPEVGAMPVKSSILTHETVHESAS